MKHRVIITAFNPAGAGRAVSEITYSEADFIATFSAEDRAVLLAGGALAVDLGSGGAWACMISHPSTAPLTRRGGSPAPQSEAPRMAVRGDPIPG